MLAPLALLSPRSDVRQVTGGDVFGSAGITGGLQARPRNVDVIHRTGKTVRNRSVAGTSEQSFKCAKKRCSERRCRVGAFCVQEPWRPAQLRFPAVQT
jgi:hypothetical protein